MHDEIILFLIIFKSRPCIAVAWHVADPTRRYIGGFTAEGVDFYGNALLTLSDNNNDNEGAGAAGGEKSSETQEVDEASTAAGSKRRSVRTESACGVVDV